MLGARAGVLVPEAETIDIHVVFNAVGRNRDRSLS